MKRTNLYRGKRQDTGEWVESPGLLVHKDGTVIMAFSADDDQITTGPVFSESIGQHTGLKDRNGKEIFEGDILQMWDSDAGEREWQETVVCVHGAFGYIVREYPEDSFHAFATHKSITKPVIHDAIIIGNIHDNPELLNPSLAI